VGVCRSTITTKSTQYLSQPPTQHTRQPDAIADGDRLEEPPELGLNFHSDPSMAPLARTVKAGCSVEIASITRDPVKRLLWGILQKPAT
jgi:hypothetical protein